MNEVAVQSYNVPEFDDVVCSSRYNFFLCHFNIRSFHANADEVLLFLSSLTILPDIIILSETWFSPDSTMNIDGYYGHHACRTDRRGGGVSVYVRKVYSATEVPEFSYVTFDLELCTVKVTAHDQVFIVTGVYRPPAGNLTNFTDRIREVTEAARPADTSLLVGDLNIDLLNLLPSHYNFINDCYAASFVPLIDISTHDSANVSTCIDHIWSSKTEGFLSGVFDVSITDHYPIFLLSRLASHNDVYIKQFRDHSVSSINELRGRLMDFPNLRFVMDNDSTTIGDRVDFFSRNLFEIYDQCCPIRSKNVSVKNSLKPWITSSLKHCINYKYVLFRKFKRGQISFQRYNLYKNILGRVIRRSKARYYCNKFSSCRSDPKTTWRTVNALVARRGDKPVVRELSIGNEILTRPIDIANNFNSYFATVAADLENNIPTTVVSPMDYMGEVNPHSYFARPVRNSDVVSIVRNLPNKSSNFNCVPVFIFKQCVDILCPIIVSLFNDSVEAGVFPDCLKVARITPVFKKGNRKCVNNYRPICNLSILSKIFEKLMYHNLRTFLEQNNLISSHQFGFRENYSTTDAVTEFIDNACTSLESGNVLLSVFLDLTKAFDTVNHGILLQKLLSFGIRGNVHAWFESYLKDRRQFVSIGTTHSRVSTLNIGVPQGSVLGPLLFLLYINDLSRSSDILNCVHFADDTTLFLSNENVNSLAHLANIELLNVDTWLRANRLSLNVAKTSYMLITDAKVGEVEISVAGSEIQRVEKAKFLGVMLDDRMSFRHHVKDVCSQLSRSVGMLRRITSLVPRRIRLLIYNALVFSRVSYAVAAWGRGSYASNVDLVLRRAKKCIAYPANSSPETDGLLNFDSIYRYFTAVKLYKIIHLDQHAYFTRSFEGLTPAHEHNTRFSVSNSFNVPLLTKSKSQRMFLYQSVVTWNSLPNHLKNSTNLSTFKINLKKFLIEKQSDYSR